MSGWFWAVAVEALIETVALLGFGYLVADVVGARQRWDPVTKFALAFPSLVAYAFVLMIAHMASGGLVFSRPWIVRGITAMLATALAIRKLARRRQGSRSPWKEMIPLAAVVAGGLLLWGFPIVRLLPLASIGDIRWHMGWANQLMNGQTTPNSIVTGSIPNYYPWMFHAFAAFVASFTRGGHAYHALAPLQLLQVAGGILSLFALGRTLGRSSLAGVAVSFFGGIGGGLSIALAPGFPLRPATPTGGGRSTYSSSFNNFPPPLPWTLHTSCSSPSFCCLWLG